MKTFCFTVDDNIRFLKEITENKYESIFDHPYLKMYKRLHEEYGLKVQLNLFYEMDGFNLSMMPADYLSEWRENSHWLKMSFHSKLENVKPYESSGYDELYGDCKAVNDQIIRFATEDVLAQTTTVHYCLVTPEGLSALEDNGVSGLLGIFGTEAAPKSSYNISESDASLIRKGCIVKNSGMAFANIDIILNLYSAEDIIDILHGLSDRDTIRVMIHEQYFYPDYPAFQPNFEDKLKSAFSFLRQHGYESGFMQYLI